MGLKVTIYNFLVSALNKLSSALYYKEQLTSDVQFISEENQTIFFGYHDKIPFNKAGDKVLCHRGAVSSSDKEAITSRIEVGYYELKDGNTLAGDFRRLGDTNSWCWQQGSMLQWLPGMNFTKVLFNDIVNGRFGSKIVDVSGNEAERELQYPIYALNNDGSKGLSVDFGRLGWLRPGYGYIHPDIEVDHSVKHPDDGLSIVDMNMGTAEVIIKLSDLVSFISNEEKEHYSYINHATFSPDSAYITFFHIVSDLKDKRRIRLFSYNMKSGSIDLLIDDKAISHFCWIAAEKMLITFTANHYFGTWRYGVLDITTKKFDILNGAFLSDGHPMLQPTDKNVFISDAYPDKNGNYFVLKGYLNSSRKEVLYHFHSPNAFRGEVRCDLHPRWNYQGDVVCVDVIRNGSRSIGLLKLGRN